MRPEFRGPAFTKENTLSCYECLQKKAHRLRSPRKNRSRRHRTKSIAESPDKIAMEREFHRKFYRSNNIHGDCDGSIWKANFLSLVQAMSFHNIKTPVKVLDVILSLRYGDNALGKVTATIHGWAKIEGPRRVSVDP